MKSNRENPKENRSVAGLDNRDGHRRITGGDNYCPAGGSGEPRKVMTIAMLMKNTPRAVRMV